MANTILHKRASTQGKVPLTGNLSLGELSINTFDGRLYTLKNDGSATVVDLTQNDKITLGGDATGTSTNPSAGSNWSNLNVTLASTGVVAGNYGGPTQIPTIVVDAKGRITSLTTNAISSSITLAAGSGANGSVSTGGTLTILGAGGITTTVASGTYTITASGTSPTANVSLWDSISTTPGTSVVYYPQLATTISGNTQTQANVNLSYNPAAGQGTLYVPAVVATSVTASTIGNATSALIGSTAAVGTVNANQINAATIGNAGAVITGATVTTTGNVVVGQNLTVTGNLTVQGQNTVIGSQDLTINDSVINLHTFANLAPLSGDDGRDVGLKFHYYKTNDNVAFLGWANDTGYLEYYAAGNEGAGNAFVGSAYGTIKTGELVLGNSTASTSTTTGALRVTGGAGIAGAVYAGSVYDSGNRVLTTATTHGNAATGTDVTVSGAYNNLTLTLVNVATAGTYGNATHAPAVTLNTKGLVTSIAPTLITPAWSSITATPTTLSGYGITDALSTSSTVDGGVY